MATMNLPIFPLPIVPGDGTTPSGNRPQGDATRGGKDHPNFARIFAALLAESGAPGDGAMKTSTVRPEAVDTIDTSVWATLFRDDDVVSSFLSSLPPELAEAIAGVFVNPRGDNTGLISALSQILSLLPRDPYGQAAPPRQFDDPGGVMAASLPLGWALAVASSAVDDMITDPAPQAVADDDGADLPGPGPHPGITPRPVPAADGGPLWSTVQPRDVKDLVTVPDRDGNGPVDPRPGPGSGVDPRPVPVAGLGHGAVQAPGKDPLITNPRPRPSDPRPTPAFSGEGNPSGVPTKGPLAADPRPHPSDPRPVPLALDRDGSLPVPGKGPLAAPSHPHPSDPRPAFSAGDGRAQRAAVLPLATTTSQPAIAPAPPGEPRATGRQATRQTVERANFAPARPFASGSDAAFRASNPNPVLAGTSDTILKAEIRTLPSASPDRPPASGRFETATGRGLQPVPAGTPDTPAAANRAGAVATASGRIALAERMDTAPLGPGETRTHSDNPSALLRPARPDPAAPGLDRQAAPMPPDATIPLRAATSRRLGASESGLSSPAPAHDTANTPDRAAMPVPTGGAGPGPSIPVHPLAPARPAAMQSDRSQKIDRPDPVSQSTGSTVDATPPKPWAKAVATEPTAPCPPSAHPAGTAAQPAAPLPTVAEGAPRLGPRTGNRPATAVAAIGATSPAGPAVAAESSRPADLPTAGLFTAEVGTGPLAATTPLAGHGSPAASADLSRHVAHQLVAAAPRTGDRAVELRLNPEELGRVRMTMHHTDGTITLAIQADRGETLDLMRRHIALLEAQFRDIGYSDIRFSFGTSGQGGQGNQAGQQATGDATLADPAATPVAPTAANATPPSPPDRIDGLDLRL